MVAWIQSLGGPLIAVAEDDLAAWRGGEEIDSEGNELEEEETDYWRACEIDEEVGLVRVAGRDALLLNNGPLPTAYLPEIHLFVQEMAMTSRRDVIDVVVSIFSDILWHDMFFWDAGGVYELFDAAEVGDQIEDRGSTRFVLPYGRFRVRTAEVKPAPEHNIWVFLIQLVPDFVVK